MRVIPVFGALVGGLVGALLATPVARRVAIATDFLAYPSGRGVHERATPLLGGVAVVAGFLAGGLAGWALLGDPPGSRFLGFVVGALLVSTMGVVDDRVNLSWFPKLLGQVVAAVIFLASGGPGDAFFATPIWIVLSLIWIVGLTNAMNFLDNMDGVSPGITAVAALAFVFLGMSMGRPWIAIGAAALCGASIGFVRYNFSPASIFLGDGGSLFLGYALGCSGWIIAWGAETPAALLVPVLVLSYPVFDITLVSVTRYARGQSLTQGGRDHSSHRLCRILAGPRATALTIYGVCLLSCAVAVLLDALAFDPATVTLSAAVLFSYIGFGLFLCRRAPVPESASGEAPPATP